MINHDSHLYNILLKQIIILVKYQNNVKSMKVVNVGGFGIHYNKLA